jgi:threonine dehydrogenase-like Zn-dependent dehydrogenase
MEPSVSLPAREVPVKGRANIVVCGAGPSGIIAAVAAARCGADVILVEKRETLGGMATTGLVNPISEFNIDGKRVIEGIPWELIKKMNLLNGADIRAPSGNIHFDSEIFKLAAHRILNEAGVKLYLNTHPADCVMKDNRITHIVLESCGSIFALKADCFIDCSGNADLCLLAGAPFQEEPDNTELQPATLCFQLGGVDKASLGKTYFEYSKTRYTNFEVRSVLEELARSEKIPNFGGPWFIAVPSKDIVTVNMTRGAVDCTDPENLGRVMGELREDVFCFVEKLKKNVPAFRNCWLVQTAAQLGCRESRRIKGIYTLTEEDLLGGKHFDDAVACSGHPVDIHRARSGSQDVTFLDKPAYIPFRSLIMENYDNLIVAGRCISADRKAFASLRVMAPAMAVGQAAGTAAALSYTGKTSLQCLDITDLKKLLREHHALI